MHLRSRQTALALGLILVCLIAEAVVLRIGIDDLDEGYFVQQGVRVLHGQIPYRDFESLYAPGLAYTHAALFGLLGGPLLMLPRALSLAARAGTALLLFGMARPLVRQPLWAAMPGLYLLVALDDAPVRWEPHPGWLSTLLAVLAAWCLSHRPTRRRLAAAGVCAGGAFVFKQNTGVFMLAAIVVRGAAEAWPTAANLTKVTHPRLVSANAIHHRGKSSATWRTAVRQRVSVILLPIAAFGIVTAVWLAPLLIALHGDVTHLGVLIGAVNQAGLFAGPEWPVLVPALCLVGGVWLWRSPFDARLRWYVVAGSALSLTQYPRMDALHLVWSAPLLLVSGAVCLDRLRPAIAGLLLLGAFALTAPTLGSRLAAVQQPSVPIQAVPYAAGIEVPERTRADLEGIVADIQTRTRPNEPIFVYPSSPLLYTLTDRPNPVRFDHVNPGAADARQIEQVMDDLATANVRLVVISDFWEAAWGPPGPNADLEAWLAGRFTEVARYGAYRVLSADL
ncbi:MAG: hypothetical protein LC797_15610 [Chloroflexi bacterium]|nr:hypothetical protein [Chloroflexota bacterium]